MPKNRNQNEILNHVSGQVVIHGGSFANVGKNQFNNCTFRQPFVRPPGKGKKRLNLPQLSEFTEVKRGDIYKGTSGVSYSWRLYSNGKDNTEAAVYYAELNIAGPFGREKFTVKTYRGRNAMKEWRRDFLRCSDPEDWCRDIPLFGYNTSSLPLLILCGELIPIAHLKSPTGLPMDLMAVYFDLLKNTLGCFLNEIWMDPKNGRFCRGPAGPKCWDWDSNLSGISVPADVDFLKEGVLVRYLSSKKNDRSFLWALVCSALPDPEHNKNFRSNHPQVLSNFRSTTIAFNRNVRWWSYYSGSFKRNKVIRSGGLARFRLKDGQRHFNVRSADPSQSWLAQALSVFHAHGIRLDEDLSQYKLVYAIFYLKGTLKRSKSKQQQRHQLCDPIYFFLESCPSPDTHFYFWSLDPTGRKPLSQAMCNYLGLPFKLSLKPVYRQKTWPTEIYKALNEYQISRGFDPRTVDFARCMQYQTWEVVPPENRFQELDGDKNNLLSTSEQLLPELFNHPQSSEGIALSELADDNHLEQPLPDDFYSLKVLFDGNQKRAEFAFIPHFHTPHSLNTVLVGNSSCRVMKRAQFPKLFALYAHMFVSADRPSNPEILLDLD